VTRLKADWDLLVSLSENGIPKKSIWNQKVLPPSVPNLRLANDTYNMSRTARPINIEAELQTGGTERDLTRWVEATRLIMKILDRKRVDEEVFPNRPYHFGRCYFDFIATLGS
jgi:hypothetical protein